jgi:putative serine protease PepD
MTADHSPPADNGVNGTGAAPPRLPNSANDAPPEFEGPLLVVSREEIDRAPAVVSRRRAMPGPIESASRPTKLPLNPVAVAAFVVALAGIVLFGAVTGLIAIALGSVAIGTIQRDRQRGSGFAVSAILLGLADVTGWIVALALFFAPASPDVDFAEIEPSQAFVDNLSPAIKRAMNANVLIKTRSGLFGGALGGATVLGSGVIASIRDGVAYIVTNRHVIDPHSDFGHAFEPGSAGDIEVKVIGQAAQRGRVQWVAPDGIDLAVVSVALPAIQIEPADCSRIDPLQIGERVFAIGNPFGFGWTQTPGEISQLRVQKKAARLVELVQTSAAINQGNSGGGLYDHDGKLIGITTWSSDKRVAEGISFAIAFTTLRALNPACLPSSPPAKKGPSEKKGPGR